MEVPLSICQLYIWWLVMSLPVIWYTSKKPRYWPSFLSANYAILAVKFQSHSLIIEILENGYEFVLKNNASMAKKKGYTLWKSCGSFIAFWRLRSLESWVRILWTRWSCCYYFILFYFFGEYIENRQDPPTKWLCPFLSCLSHKGSVWIWSPGKVLFNMPVW